jgi:hypothetical protein
MAKQQVIEEGPTTDPTPTPGPSGGPPDEDIDLMQLSCGELQDLWDLTVVTIMRLERQLEDTPKARFIQRRALVISMQTHMAMKTSIGAAMIDKNCP